LSRLGGVLADARDKEGDAPADDRANKIEAVRAEIEGHQKRLSRKRRDLDADLERWEADGWSEEEIDAERKRWVEEQIVPIERALKDARRRLEVLLDTASPDNAASLGAGEMLGILDQIIGDWPTYPTATKQVLVQALVERVRVIADKSPAADEVWIQVVWRAGATDLLLAWRNPALDKRPFTEEEDGALRRLWASSCTWAEITEALQPGRRYNLVRRRAAELGITGAGRSRAWREAADLASKSYGQLHPEVAYWVREGGAWREEVEGGAAVRRMELPAGITMPERVSDWLMVVDSEEATSTPGRQPDRPP